MAKKSSSRHNTERGGMSRLWSPDFLKSSGGAAVITILLSGFSLTGWIHSLMKHHESFHENQRQTVLNALKLITQCKYASEDLIDLTGPNFDPNVYPGIDDQRASMKGNYNNCVKQWQEEEDTAELSITKYFQSEPTAINDWHKAKKSAVSYMNCANRWYLSHNRQVTDTQYACLAENESLENEITRFNESTQVAQQCWWNRWLSLV